MASDHVVANAPVEEIGHSVVFAVLSTILCISAYTNRQQKLVENAQRAP
jgi:hypothetical protein